jgi:hypothetical protein
MDDGKAHLQNNSPCPRFSFRESPREPPFAFDRVHGAHVNLVALTLYCRHPLYKTVIETILEEFFPLFPIRALHAVVKIPEFCSAVALNSAVHLVHIPDHFASQVRGFPFIVQV